MTLEIDIKHHLGKFLLDARFETGGGLIALFGRSGSGKTSIVNIIAGLILCFAKAIGEFGATITFVSNIPGETQTLPSAIYTFTQVPGGDAGALRLTAISIAISIAALLASELLARRAHQHLELA